MKTEQEIRKHRNNLVLLNCQPCGCGATSHADECREAQLMISMEILALSWVLGERDEYDESVAALNRNAKQFARMG